MNKLLLKINIIKKLIALYKQLLARKKEKRIPIKKLAEAMAMFEGFYKQGSLAQRNHNPLNLRWSKFQTMRKNNFSYFANNEIGWKAGIYDLSCKCQGKTQTRLNGESSILELIKVWAPASDNNIPKQYAQFVADRLGISINYQLKNFI